MERRNRLSIDDKSLKGFVDDLSVSGGRRLRKVRNLQERIVKDEGFSVKPLKDGQKKLMYREQDRQQMTGLVLNQKVNLPREKRKEIIGSTKAPSVGKGNSTTLSRGELFGLRQSMLALERFQPARCASVARKSSSPATLTRKGSASSSSVSSP
jgi:hypothetical protein